MLKKIIRFLFREKIRKIEADIIAQKIVDSYVIKNVTKKADGKTYATLEPLKIYSYKKPDIIDFISDSDYRVLLNFYCANIYGSKNDLNKMMPPYPYKKYDWNTLLQIIWVNQNYYKHLQEFKRIKLTKVELCCSQSCQCCKNIVNIPINIEKIRELPIKECDFSERLCIGSRYFAVTDFNIK